MVPPQPSEIGPQVAPTDVHERGWHCGTPQTLAVPPPPQTAGAVHTPQVSVPPQPSGMMPQFAPLAPQLVCLQTLPHWLGTPPPPQLAGATQSPHCSSPPQPSATGPQVAPTAAHVFFLQLGGG